MGASVSLPALETPGRSSAAEAGGPVGITTGPGGYLCVSLIRDRALVQVDLCGHVAARWDLPNAAGPTQAANIRDDPGRVPAVDQLTAKAILNSSGPAPSIMVHIWGFEAGEHDHQIRSGLHRFP